MTTATDATAKPILEPFRLPKKPEPVRLNIGAGDSQIEGYIPIDRKFGTEAYPLTDFADASVDEVRASHVLEHFPKAMKQDVVKEWARVLKPGGKLKISVPDWNKLRQSTDRLIESYVYGGQTDENDYHKCGFNQSGLKALMESVGIDSISQWAADYPDCSANPISINLEGYKYGLPPAKTVMLSSIPRYGALAAQGCLHDAARHFGLLVSQAQGAYWSQCLSRAISGAIRDGFEWIVTHDYDTMFTWSHLQKLFDVIRANPTGVDAVAPLQVSRGRKEGLLGCNASGNGKVFQTEDGGKAIWFRDKSPFEVMTAHFGLTVIRVAAIKKMPKPWFDAVHDMNDEWGENRIDEDVNFWIKWKGVGNTLWMDPQCVVGHLEEMITSYDENYQVVHEYPVQWRTKNGYMTDPMQNNRPGGK